MHSYKLLCCPPPSWLRLSIWGVRTSIVGTRVVVSVAAGAGAVKVVLEDVGLELACGYLGGRPT